jgi:hypothetical protein
MEGLAKCSPSRILSLIRENTYKVDVNPYNIKMLCRFDAKSPFNLGLFPWYVQFLKRVPKCLPSLLYLHYFHFPV